MQAKPHKGRRWRRALGVLATAVAVAGCGITQLPNRPIGEEWTEEKREWRGDRSKQEGAKRRLVAVSLSGGGMRASALGYSILRTMQKTFSIGNNKEWNMLDEVDVISGVSGGSVPAAYVVAKGREELAKFERDWIEKDVEKELLQRAMNPLLAAQIAVTDYTRSDIFRTYIDEELFKGMTYYGIEAAERKDGERRPHLIISAADIGAGETFSFTQKQFNELCGWLGDITLARAVTASSAFPIVLAPVRVVDYGDRCRRDEESKRRPDEISELIEEAEGALHRRKTEQEIQLWKVELKVRQLQRRKTESEKERAKAHGAIQTTKKELDERRTQRRDYREQLERAETRVKAREEAIGETRRKLESAKDEVEEASSILEDAERERKKAEAASEDAQAQVRQKAKEDKELPDERAALEKLWDWVKDEQQRGEVLRAAIQEAQGAEVRLQHWRGKEVEARRNFEEVERKVAEQQERYEEEEKLLAEDNENETFWRDILAQNDRWAESDDEKLQKWEARREKAAQELERTNAAIESEQGQIANLQEERLEIESAEKELAALGRARERTVRVSQKRTRRDDHGDTFHARQLVDGGLLDNLGLAGVVGIMKFVMEARQVSDLPEYLARLPKEALIVIVDAGTESDRDAWFNWETPGLITTALDTVSSAMRTKSSLLRKEAERVGQELEEAGIKTRVLVVGFGNAGDETAQGKECREWFLTRPTRWRLEETERRLILELGQALLTEHDDYKEFVRQTGFEVPEGPTSNEVCRKVNQIRTAQEKLPSAHIESRPGMRHND